ncbi:MAG: ISAzo13 family transposase [Proteobacteria bacterium]|nr:ISAzo13 family transposase [Pseudomonadota bacterium]
MKKQERLDAEESIRKRYLTVAHTLNERARRMFVANEAKSLGYGGRAVATRATGMAPSTIDRGTKELDAINSGEAEPLSVDRVRREGGGRKLKEKEEGLLDALRDIVEASTVGDPESALLWTARSHRNLVLELASRGYTVCQRSMGKLLRAIGYSRQANKKKIEGKQHPDRNEQFEHINETIRRQLEAGNPAISVDTKKKELVGNYKNGGRELRPKCDPEEVKGHDFVDPLLGKVSPYGVYDIEKNEGWVSVGISHDTGEFSVNSIRAWWNEMGKPLYADATSLLITADGGGSNGYRLRLWKVELQKLADEFGHPIHVCHYPPGTSKWNKIEHRLFSFITQNWRGKPLYSHQVIVNLISATTTRTGLKVRSRLDESHYPKGRRVSDKELACVNLHPCEFHGEWNYSIHPSRANEE